MNILLTNDDGINSIGLKELEKVLLNYGNVYVFAPETQQSGKACSINSFIGIKVKKINEFHYAVEGSPVDCVEAGYALLNKKIDLVVSGCNNGFNISNDIMYSGTCGACVQASFAKIKSIAFSCANYNYFYQIKDFAKEVLDFIFKNKLLSTRYFLNVNFPKVDNHKGIKLSKVYEPVYEKYFAIKTNKDTNEYVIVREKLNNTYKKDRDIDVLNDGYISITPLSQSLFKEDVYKKVKDKLK